METLTVNKSNWSNEETEIKLYADGKTGRIPQYDLKFRVVEKSTFQELSLDIDMIEWKIQLNDGNGWEETDWSAITEKSLDGSEYHSASSWDGSIRRSSNKDVRIAVALLLFMVY